MMQGMSVGGLPVAKEEDDADVASDDDGDDTDSDEEIQKQGLQDRYQAAMGDQDDSVMADASFAKYLHTQRQ
jgi:hypothetical protein